MHLPILPLPVFLLPEGRMRVRIFEKKFLSLIRIATDHEGFVIKLSTNKLNTNNVSWGSLVEIIDFNQGEDGILEIDVYCKSLVRINKEFVGQHGLQFSHVESFQHWSQDPQYLKLPLANLTSSLHSTIRHNPLLNSLYQGKKQHKATWVLARWLELLPVSLKVKSSFINHYGCKQAKFFVETIILNKN